MAGAGRATTRDAVWGSRVGRASGAWCWLRQQAGGGAGGHGGEIFDDLAELALGQVRQAQGQAVAAGQALEEGAQAFDDRRELGDAGFGSRGEVTFGGHEHNMNTSDSNCKGFEEKNPSMTHFFWFGR